MRFASLNEKSAACVFFDMEKFYDSACLYKLIDLEMARDFPRRLLYIAMQAYLSDRIFERELWWGKAYSPQAEFWLVARWETDLRGSYFTRYWTA